MGVDSLDYRVKVKWVDDPQTRRIMEILGPVGAFRVQELWAWCALFRPRGALTDADRRALGAARGWGEDLDRVWAALVECGWVDPAADGWHVHNWPDAQPWVQGAFLRSERARRGWARRRAAEGKGLL